MELFRFLGVVVNLIPSCLIFPLLFAPLSVFCQQVSHIPTDKEDHKKFVQQFQQGITDVSFTENKGQWDPAILYQASTTRGNIFLTNSGIQYGMRKKIEQKSKEIDEYLALVKKESSDHEYLFWNVEFLNANSKAEFDQQQRKGNVQNYYKGKGTQPITNVRGFGEIHVKDIYPQIDIQYHGYEGSLKYDFIMKPGSNVKDILLRYRGIKSLKINNEGQLVINTKWGEFLESRPYSYQIINGIKSEVEVEYRIYKRDKVGFFIKQNYNPQYDLVIDPTLLWSTFLGGLGEDPAYGISTDQDNNVLVTGWTFSVDFPTLNANDDTYGGGDYDAYVSKFSPDGVLIWSTYLGGSLRDAAYDIECDDNNNIYITGTTNSVNFPTSINAFQGTHQGGDDVFLTKFDKDGALIWSSYYGGSIHETGENLSIDSQGNVVLAGHTRSFNFPVTVNAYQKTIGGGITLWDVFVAKFSSDGGQLWSTFVGGSDEDFGQGVNIDSRGDIVISGESKSNDFPTKNAFQSTHKGLYDIILFKLSGDGSNLIWSTFFGGTDNSGIEVSAEGVGIDTNDNIYIAGYTNSSDFPITINPPQQWGNFGYYLFCAKFSNSGAREWSTFYGYTNGYFSSIVVSACDELWLAGFTYAEPLLPTTPDAFQKNPKGEWYTRESLIVSYSLAGDLQFASYFGGTRDEQGWGITNDKEGNILMCGLTKSPDFPTKNAYQTFYYDLEDAFIIKFTPSASSVNPSFSVNEDACSSEKIFTYTGTGASAFYWDFGDGTFSAERNPKHIFQAPGDYRVTLTASTGCIQAIIQEEVSIQIVPQASFTSDADCQLKSNFVFTGTNATTRLWEFGDGTISTEVNPVYTYQEAGEYLVKLIIQNGNCSDSISKTVLIKNLPALELGEPLGICPGEQHELSASYAGASYLWQDGSTEPTFTVTQQGTYWVEATNECGQARDTIVVSAETLPEINLGENLPLCEMTSIVLNANFSGGGSYLWQDGSTAAGFTVTQPGTYWVEATNECGQMRDTITVSAGTLPENILGEDLVLCEVTSTELNASFPEAKYLWQDGSTAATFTVAQPGTYWVKATTKCNQVRDTITVLFKTLPDIDLGENLVFCEVPVVLNAHFPETSYRWQDGSTAPTFTVTQPGTYWVEATNECGSVTDTVQAEVTCLVVIPNVITPNLDGKNDQFVIENMGTNPWKLEIFNRSGVSVYINNMYQNDWKGDDLENGIYFYWLSNQGNIYKGWIQILR